MTLIFKTWFGSLLLIAVFVLTSALWLDKPIALLIHDMFGGQRISSEFVQSPILKIPLALACVFVVCGLTAITGRQFSKAETAIVLCDISALAAESIKNQLKFAFGRTWPDSWGPDVLSLIRDNAYGFHFFHSGQSFESFPSGHAAFVAAVTSVLWLLFPKLRVICVLCIGAADVGLVMLNLHFLSDVIAGSFVGVSAGLFAVTLWRPIAARKPRSSTNEKKPILC